MFDTLPLSLLVLFFVGAATAVWLAGIRLSDATDALAQRFGLGEVLGGMILLAVVTNLPEIAITVSAALHHRLGIAVGNILGGIALQTVVLVVLDVVGLGKAAPLTYRVASLELVLEGVLVMAILALVVMGHQFPTSLTILRMAPVDLLIAVLWVGGIYLVSRSRNALPWQPAGAVADGQQDEGKTSRQRSKRATRQGVSTTRSIVVFLVGAVVTLIGGVILEQTGGILADRIGMSGVLFGATVLAAATSLPEVSTGLAAVKLGDYQLAFSDILGGNAFLPVLFLLATLLSGQAVLPMAQKTDIYLTGLSMLLTAVYIYGLLFRPRRQIARMGIDSLLVLLLYVLGIIGLFFIV